MNSKWYFRAEWIWDVFAFCGLSNLTLCAVCIRISIALGAGPIIKTDKNDIHTVSWSIWLGFDYTITVTLLWSALSNGDDDDADNDEHTGMHEWNETTSSGGKEIKRHPTDKENLNLFKCSQLQNHQRHCVTSSVLLHCRRFWKSFRLRWKWRKCSQWKRVSKWVSDGRVGDGFVYVYILLLKTIAS